MALTQQTILEKLHDIQAPGGRMSLVEAGAVRGIEVEDTDPSKSCWRWRRRPDCCL